MQFRFSSDVAILPRDAQRVIGGAPRMPAKRQPLSRVGLQGAISAGSDVAGGEFMWNLLDVGASSQRSADVLPL
jgi:hypothetical protein